MTFTKNRAVALAIMVVAVCAGPWGCALKAPPAPPALSDEVRAQLNTVGVPAARFLPDSQLQAPTSGKGWGAAKGAGYGFVAGATPGLAIASAVRGCGGGGPAAVICGSILLLGLGVGAAGGALGALGGTVYGAVTAEPASRIDAAQIELGSAIVDRNVQSTLRDHVLRMARERSALSFVALEDRELTDPTDYGSLAMTHGIDTVLEVDVSSVSFAGHGINPPVRLLMTASARLVRTSDGVELHSERFVYRSLNEHKFVEWAAENGLAFREEIDRGVEALAGDVVQLLFRADAASDSVSTANP
jgi:hypothetical protein